MLPQIPHPHAHFKRRSPVVCLCLAAYWAPATTSKKRGFDLLGQSHALPISLRLVQLIDFSSLSLLCAITVGFSARWSPSPYIE